MYLGLESGGEIGAGGGSQEKGVTSGQEAEKGGPGSRIPEHNIKDYVTKFCNRKRAKRKEPINLGQEPGLRGTESGKFGSFVPTTRNLNERPMYIF